MISARAAYALASVILALMAILMIIPVWEETATVDETVILGAGYSYWQGYRFRLNPEHPPLAQLWSALPLQFVKVTPPPNEDELLSRPTSSNAARWDHLALPFDQLFPKGIDFYYCPVLEAELLGRNLVYGGVNDADLLLRCGRLMQVGLTLATGFIIFAWAKSLTNPFGGLVALTTWAFNPVALAYGHLILTDPAIALFLPLAVWMFSRFLQTPNLCTMGPASVAFGGALLSKFTAILLVPVFAALILAFWQHLIERVSARRFCGYLLSFIAIAWAMVLVVYAFQWKPAPVLDAHRAEALNVPVWFRALRPILIPPTFFKGLAIVLAHVSAGHEAYLCGRWSMVGWWYYYPVALCLKLPIPLLVLVGLALFLALSRFRHMLPLEIAPLAGALLYLVLAMANKADIGIRHLLPMFPMLSVIIGVETARAGRRVQIASVLLAASLAAVVIFACPFYIQYFNAFAGGSKNGYKYLLDSNLDWGQDVKRLKQFLNEQHIEHVYINHFRSLAAVEYYNIPHTFVDAGRAREIHKGYLVVSATRLMRPEWTWLRQQHKPVAQIAYTLFVFKLP
jgi:4-amino-4-deoxy-L-arabinose transferase-like glycosyltransferase